MHRSHSARSRFSVARPATSRYHKPVSITPPRSAPVRELIGFASAFATSPLAFLERMPKGDGSSVLVIPGFLTSDRSTVVLRRFLRSRGYRAYGWNLGRNNGRVYALLPKVVERLEEIRGRSTGPIHLVGWSLGGVLAREAARHRPEDVRRIVTLGTPVIGGPKYTAAASYYRKRGIDVDAIEADVKERNAVPLGVPVSAIFSKNDRVVAWRAQFDDNPDNDVDHLEVRTTHAGLGFSPSVLSLLARELARERE